MGTSSVKLGTSSVKLMKIFKLKTPFLHCVAKFGIICTETAFVGGGNNQKRRTA